MKKRGEHKGSAGHAAAVKHAAGKPVHVLKGTLSHHKRSEPSAIIAAERFVKREEQAVEKEVRFLLSPQEFHVVTFISSLIILSFIFSSWSMLFYAVLSIGALLFAHFLMQHHRLHDVLAIGWIFFVPIAITLMVFRDVLPRVMLGIYVLSAISTVIIYYYHKKVHSQIHQPLKIMWQVAYSKVIAITVAVLLLCLLPYTFPDTFLSIFELLYLYVLPVAFVFFFASKFFYLYFFDRRHIRIDLLRSLRHTITYTLVFIVLMMCVYSLLAVWFYNSRAAEYNANLDSVLIGISNVEKAMMRQPEYISSLTVAKDVSGLSSELRDQVSLEKSLAMERTISLGSIIDDSYFDDIWNNSVNMLRFVFLQGELVDLKADVLDKYGYITGILDNGTSFEDGSTGLEAYAASLRSDVEQRFVPYYVDTGAQEIVDALNSPSPSYSYFEGQGFFYWMAQEGELSFIYDSSSIFGRQMSMVLRHSRPFKQLAQLVVNDQVIMSKEFVSGTAMDYLYSHRDADTLPMSEAVRYGVMKDNLDVMSQRLSKLGRLSFKVE